MAVIKLNKGFETIVDDEDFEHLNQWKWTCSLGYAVRCGLKGDKYALIFMHRSVNDTPDGFHTDHINMNKLDNRKSNLRTVTKSQNNCNKRPQSNNTSGFKGVSWHKGNKRWQAYIKINGKNIAAGSYGSKYEAAHAHDLAALKLHGEYARLNLACSAFHGRY